MKVAVFGAKGRMGQEIIRAVEDAADMELVAAIDAGDELAAAEQADVVIDFTHPDAVLANIDWCLSHDINMVVGTSGFSAQRLAEVEKKVAANGRVHILIASNFSISAVLMMHFTKLAAPFFESVEVIELHHPGKADAPSGTAATTAEQIAAARGQAGCAPMPDATATYMPGARGAVVEGVHVHSVRLQGLFAHQEVVFGNPGEMLTIRDDSFQRTSYMPGVLAATRAVLAGPGFTFGIESLLGIA